MEAISGTFGILIILAGVLLVILWIMLPFAVFGIKDKINRTNSLLQKLVEQNEKTNLLLTPSSEQNKKPKVISPKQLEACLKCQYLKDDIYKQYRICKKTGWNLKEWEEKEYPGKKVNACAGKYFKPQV